MFNLYRQYIKRIPVSVKIVSIFIPLLCVFCIVFFFPKKNIMRNIQADIRRLDVALQKAKAISGNMQLPDEYEKKSWEKVKLKLEKLPAEINVPGIMEELSQLESANNIKDASLSSARNPATVKIQDSRLKIDDLLLHIRFRCYYFDLARFIKGMDNNTHSILIESLEIKRESPPVVSVDLQIRPVSFIQ